MTSGLDIVRTAKEYQGWAYKLGAEVDPGPIQAPGFLDCSELVEIACERNGIDAPDGTPNQYRWMLKIPLEQAYYTPGALLMVYRGPQGGGGNGNHIAISIGDGNHTMEARSTAHGVGIFSIHSRGWTDAGLIPGVDYNPRIPAIDIPQPEEEEVPFYVQYGDRIYRVVGNTASWLHPEVFAFDQSFAAFVGKPITLVTDQEAAQKLLDGRYETREGAPIIIFS